MSFLCTGLSCERCATGYMRENLTLSSSYESCIPCNCQGRGVTDPPECDELTGKCLNCRNGTMGDNCEKCAQHVAGAECDNCTDQYWGLQEDGCRGNFLKYLESAARERRLRRGEGEMGKYIAFSKISKLFKV